jgi:uncharacterized protein (DUF885 family)
MRHHPIYPLSNEIVDEIAFHFPTAATYLGIAGHDHRMPDLSPDGAERALEALRRFRSRVDELPAASDRWDRLAVEVAKSALDEDIEYLELGEHLMDVNSMASPLQDLREVFDHMGRESVEHWENIVARLKSMDPTLDGYRQSLNEGRARGKRAAQRQAEAAARQAGIHASAGDSAFVALLREFEESDHSPALGAELQQAVAAARSAFGRFSEYLREDYLPTARPEDAVGAEPYARYAKRFLGTTIDPIATYEWGWTEVAAIRERMDEVAGQIRTGASIADALDLLKTEPDRSASGPDQFRELMQARTDDALSKLGGTHFDVPEQIRTCVVKLAPPGGSLGAYYVGPSEDFTRPGSVWWSLEGDGPVPLYDQVTTAYHEGFPGHHLQVGVQVSLADRLSRLHRLWMWKAGTGEGWALYAERLMEELGFLDEPDYVFGLLAAQMLRACRVVIDIGAHLDLPIPQGQPFHPGERWRFETATEMLREYATLDAAYADSEVTRYLGWPGQAISYKVGEQAILDLRDEVRRARGTAFDLEAFHRDLLEVGPVGLDLLREMILR